MDSNLESIFLSLAEIGDLLGILLRGYLFLLFYIIYLRLLINLIIAELNCHSL